MMTWVCLVHPLPPSLLQQDRAGQALGAKQPLSLVGPARIGKLLWEKLLEEVRAAHNKSVLLVLHHLTSSTVLVWIVSYVGLCESSNYVCFSCLFRDLHKSSERSEV